MKTISLQSSADDLSVALEKLTALDPHLVLLVGATDKMQDSAPFKKLAEALPHAKIIGCSTSGEIDNKGVSDKGLVIAATHFNSSTVRATSHELKSSDDSRAAGAHLAKSLLGDDLKGIFILAPGVNINGSELVKGFRDVLPSSVVLTGGLAGDGTRFQETRTILNGDSFKSHVVAIGLYGKDLVIGSGSKGGWKPFGPARRVTKSQGNVLFELDGKPALQLYKDYLGERAAELPASGLLYPFAILQDDRSTVGLIRTILNVDHEANSLILAGDIPPDSLVCLMHTDTDLLAEGSAAAATEALATAPADDADSLSIFVSCVGRRLVMGEDADEEIETAMNVLGKNAHVCGFYSYGEICPFSVTGKPELHNQTMTITHIQERPAA